MESEQWDGKSPMAQRKFYERLELFGFIAEQKYSQHAKAFQLPARINNMELT